MTGMFCACCQTEKASCWAGAPLLDLSLAICRASGRRYLVLHRVHAAAARGFHDGEADFQCRLAPASIGEDTAAGRQRVAQFAQLRLPAGACRARDLGAAALSVDVEAIG